MTDMKIERFSPHNGSKPNQRPSGRTRKRRAAGVFSFLLALMICSSAWPESLEVAPSSIIRGDKVIAIFSLTDAENEGGWVGLYRKGDPDEKYIVYRNCEKGINRWEIPMDQAGEYQLRLFKDYFQQKKGSVVGFTVTASHGSSITLKTAGVPVGGKIMVEYSIVHPDDEDKSGWIGLFLRGQPSDKVVHYKKTGGQSGTWEFVANVPPGTYEFRLFQDYYGQKLIATSSGVEVNTAYSNATLAVDPPIIPAGGKVTARFSIPEAENEGGWAGLYRRGDADDKQIGYKKCEKGPTTWEVLVNDPGEYEIRLFKDYFQQKKAAVKGFSVGRVDRSWGKTWRVREVLGNEYWEEVWTLRSDDKTFDAKFVHYPSGRIFDVQNFGTIRSFDGKNLVVDRPGYGQYLGHVSSDRKAITQGTCTWHTGSWSGGIGE